MKVAIDTETTGLVAGYNEVIEIAIIPLNDDFTRSDVPMFHTTVRPEKPDTIENGALFANGRLSRQSTEEDYQRCLDQLQTYPSRLETIKAFGEWYTANVHEKMSWLCHNGNFDMSFLNHWFSPDHIISFEKTFFNYQGRDTQRIALFLCDKFPGKFPGTALAKLTAHFNIAHENAHTAVGDALATAALYQKMLSL